MPCELERDCRSARIKLTGQRRTVARVLAACDDHPCVEELHRRAAALDPRISLATVYRTLRLFADAGIVERRDFGDGRARYERRRAQPHDHLIDLDSGEVVEFNDPEIERLKARIAERYGYRVLRHRLELYAVKEQRAALAAE